MYELTKDLLRIRANDAAISCSTHFDGAVLSQHAFVLRFFGRDGDDRLLLVNLGIDAHLDPAPEPLLAPPEDREWGILFSTENPKYGGSGTAQLDSEDNWNLPGWCAVLLGPVAVKPKTEERK